MELVDRYVPARLRRLVCMCIDKNKKYKKDGTCMKCGKHPRYTVRTCHECSTKFIKLWTHKFECKSIPVCWECLEKRDTKYPCRESGCNFGDCPYVFTHVPFPELVEKREELTLAQVIANAKKAMGS